MNNENQVLMMVEYYITDIASLNDPNFKVEFNKRYICGKDVLPAKGEPGRGWHQRHNPDWAQLPTTTQIEEQLQKEYDCQGPIIKLRDCPFTDSFEERNEDR